MKLLEKILMPIDITCDATRQIKCAIKLAKAYKSGVIVAYILPVDATQESIKDFMKEAISTKMKEVVAKLEKNKIPVLESIIEYGDPYEGIIGISESHDVNLIILTSGNKRKSEPFRLGTTAEKVMRKTDKPVWVVKNDKDSRFSNILCPVDFSLPSRRALENAVQIAHKFKASLKVLHIFDLPDSKIFYPGPSQENIEQESGKLIKKMISFMKGMNTHGINITHEVQEGEAHVQILNTIRKNKHDLLIMGTSGRTGLSRLFMGSVTEKVTREVPCSFVTTKSESLLNLNLDEEIKEIEVHLKTAKDLVEHGYYKEAINQYKICLQINDMHIPSMYSIAGLYRKLDLKNKATYYENMAKDLMARLWDKKIELEIRKHYKDV